MFQTNASLSAAPFIYYNQERVEKWEAWRAGAGAAVLLPLMNNTLEVLNITGVHRAWIPLALGGEPATLHRQIGFTRSRLPMPFHLAVKSPSNTRIAHLGPHAPRLVPR